MTYDELIDQLNFAKNAIEKRTDNPIKVIGMVKLLSQQSIFIPIHEIGFDDKTATIILELK